MLRYHGHRFRTKVLLVHVNPQVLGSLLVFVTRCFGKTCMILKQNLKTGGTRLKDVLVP